MGRVSPAGRPGLRGAFEPVGQFGVGALSRIPGLLLRARYSDSSVVEGSWRAMRWFDPIGRLRWT